MTTKLMDGTVNLRIDLENFPACSDKELASLISNFLAEQRTAADHFMAKASIVSSCLLRDK